jgi:hypothetical protein
MKRVLVAILLLAPALASAEKKPAPNPADYAVTVHVQSSQVINRYQVPTQLLDVIIDGRKYKLGASPDIQVLPVGDYKAKISQDKIAQNHEYSRVYELVFADGTTRKYSVLGESE